MGQVYLLEYGDEVNRLLSFDMFESLIEYRAHGSKYLVSRYCPVDSNVNYIPDRLSAKHRDALGNHYQFKYTCLRDCLWSCNGRRIVYDPNDDRKPARGDVSPIAIASELTVSTIVYYLENRVVMQDLDSRARTTVANEIVAKC